MEDNRLRDALLEELAVAREGAGSGVDGEGGGCGEALRRRGGIETRLIARALDDAEPAVVAFAARLLGRSADVLAVAHLARLLVHPHGQVLEGALHELTTLRSAVTPNGFEAALARAPFVLSTVASVLGEAGEGRASPPLLTLLADADLTAASLRALSRLRGRAAVSLLAALAADPPSASALADALAALAELVQQGPHPRVVRAAERWIRRTAVQVEIPDLPLRLQRALREADDVPPGRGVGSAVGTIVRGLARQPAYTCLVLAGCDPSLRPLWAACPTALTAEPAAALYGGLADRQPRVRLLSCRLLGALGESDAAAWIEELLQDDDAGVREVAIHTLARFRHQVAVPGIVRRLHDPVRAVRDAAVLALSRMDAELVSIALLRETLGTGTLHRPALAIMRASPHPAQQRFIAACLGDPRPLVRLAAIRAFERQPGADLPLRLEPLLDDPQPAVRDAAAAALARACPTAGEDFDGRPRSMTAAAAAPGAEGDSRQ